MYVRHMFLCVPVVACISMYMTAAVQASAQLKGLVLLSARLPAPWERVVQLDFGARPGEAPSKSVFCEVMAK